MTASIAGLITLASEYLCICCSHRTCQASCNYQKGSLELPGERTGREACIVGTAPRKSYTNQVIAVTDFIDESPGLRILASLQCLASAPAGQVEFLFLSGRQLTVQKACPEFSNLRRRPTEGTGPNPRRNATLRLTGRSFLSRQVSGNPRRQTEQRNRTLILLRRADHSSQSTKSFHIGSIARSKNLAESRPRS